LFIIIYYLVNGQVTSFIFVFLVRKQFSDEKANCDK